MMKKWSGFLCLSAMCAIGAERPNIVFILMDDLGYGDLTCYNPASDIATPHMDSIAEQGVRFTQFYAPSNVCGPSRRAILTGRYVSRLGEWAEAYRGTPDDAALNPVDEPFFPLFLQKAGYVNGMFGKWNVGSVNGVSTPDAQGFDYWIGSHHNTSYFLHRKGGELEFWENGEPAPQYAGTFADDVFVDKAIGFIKENRDKPFFVYLSLFTPHAPFQDPEEYSEVGGYDHKDQPGPGSPSPADRPVAKKMVEHVDQRIGDVLNTLEALGLEENTLVLFTSDNGGMRAADNSPLSGFKQQMLEGGIRVPAMVKWPGVYPADRVSDQAGISMDFSRTILAAAGAEQYVPKNRELDGIDLTPVLTGKKKGIERELFWRRREWNQTDNAVWAEGYVHGDWKYIKEFRQAAGYAQTQQGNYNADGYVELLFNLKDDIGEQNNLAGQMPEKLDAMRREFEQMRKTTVDRHNHYEIPAADQYGKEPFDGAKKKKPSEAALADPVLKHRFAFDGNVSDSVMGVKGEATANGTHTEAPAYSEDVPSGANGRSLQVGMNASSKKSGLKLPPMVMDSTAGSYSLWFKSEGGIEPTQYLLHADFPQHFLKGRPGGINAGFQGETCGGAVAVNEWNHVVVSWDNTADQGCLYLNGVPAGRTAYSGAVNPGFINVGGYNMNDDTAQLSSQSKMKLYDLRFYSGLLDEDDVAGLYANTGQY